MIGANNYGFAAIVERCVTNWLTSPSWWKNYCSDDSDMTSRFTATRQTQETTNVSAALSGSRTAMTNAGYGDSQYKIIAQTYWTPIPRSTGFRYGETGWTRQSVGGCGVWNRDANWAHDVVVKAMNEATTPSRSPGSPTSSRSTSSTRSTGAAVRERRRPARGDRDRHVAEPRRRRPFGVGLADPHGDDDRRALPAPGGQPRRLLGQLAMRNCLRLAYNGGAVAAGAACASPTGSRPKGEPQMGLQ